MRRYRNPTAIGKRSPQFHCTPPRDRGRHAGTNTPVATDCFFGVYRHLLKYAGVVPVPLLLVAKAPTMVPAMNFSIAHGAQTSCSPVKGPLPPDTISALAVPILTASLSFDTGAAEKLYFEFSVASIFRRTG